MSKRSVALILSWTLTISVLTGCISSGNSNKYKTKIEWALQDPYCFAVAVDGYSGDVAEAGTWTASVSNKKLGEAPVYDIYIETEELNSIGDLGDVDYTVGGVNSMDIELTLENGQYIYVVPVSLAYEPKGYLVLKLNK